MSITGCRAYSPIREKTRVKYLPPYPSSAIDWNLLHPSERQINISFHHQQSTYLRQFTHLSMMSSNHIYSLTPGMIIGCLWIIYDTWRYSLYPIWRDFIISSCCCPTLRLIGWLSRRVCSPTFMNPYTPIHFDTSTDVLPFLIQITGVFI